MRRGRSAAKARLRAFLNQAQSEDGGYYKHTPTKRPVDFIRPLGGPWVRVKDMRNGETKNVHFEDLVPLPEMEVLGLMTWTEDDERRSTGPETVSTKTEDDEPQEPSDVEFLR